MRGVATADMLGGVYSGLDCGAPRSLVSKGRSICSTTHYSASRCVSSTWKPRLLGHWGTSPGLNFV